MGACVPDWLLRAEEYAPRADRDAFIDKSIRSFLRVLSAVRSRGRVADSRIKIHPALKLLTTLVFILLLSLSQSSFFLFFAAALLLVLLSLHQGELILKVLSVSLPAAGFTFLVMLPSAIWGNAPGVVSITLKVALSVAAVRLFTATTGWHAMSGALKAFHVADLFILVLDITVRYVELLGALSLQMLYALKLRSVGRNRGKAASVSGIAAVLFLRSREMADEMYGAMQCRGFTGRYRSGRGRRLSFADLIPVSIDALLAAVFFMTGLR